MKCVIFNKQKEMQSIKKEPLVEVEEDKETEDVEVVGSTEWSVDVVAVDDVNDVTEDCGNDVDVVE